MRLEVKAVLLALVFIAIVALIVCLAVWDIRCNNACSKDGFDGGYITIRSVATQGSRISCVCVEISEMPLKVDQ